MVTLRKEIKMGAAIGVTVIGIVGVYGLMASLSGGEKVAKTDTDTVLQSSEDKLPNGGQPGLPPKEDPQPAPKPTPIVTAPKPTVDPFAESNRKDGIANNDAILAALSTGKLVSDVKPTKTDDAPSQIDSPLVQASNKLPAAHAKSPLVTVADDPSSDSTNDQPAAKPAKGSAKTVDKPAAATGGDKYTVEAGDTFSTIAAKVYGSKKFSTVLVKANPDVNPSRLKIGHVINVPPKQAVASVQGAVSTDAGKLAAPIDTSRQYRIQPGDTLSRIATKLYGKSAMWEDIYNANKSAIGDEPGRLKVGSVLSLPSKPTQH